jgi:heterodisulfide reductase subunit B
MELAFYPGCSLEGMANDYGQSIRAVFRQLDITLVEIDDWSCCGATAAHSMSELMSVALPARNIAAAEKMGLDIVSPCANCFNRLRFSQIMVQKQVYEIPWNISGSIQIHDMTRFLAQDAIVARVARQVQQPLKGLRLVAYYGCQMVRPPRLTGFTDYENPQTIDRLMQTVGAEVLDWSYKTTCCGASIGIGRRDIQETLTQRLLDKAHATGAEAIVVSCPLCQSNLDMTQNADQMPALPIFYFTELLQLAFAGTGGSPDWFKMHIVDPVPMLHRLGVLA